MKQSVVELLVGLFVIAGIVCLGFLSIKLGKSEIVGGHGYSVRAEFGATGGLASGASVEIAGVRIGRVARIGLKEYRAVVVLRIDPSVQLPDDTIASIRTRGLIGDRYVALAPGGSPHMVQPGGLLFDTEDAVDVEQLIAQFIHGKI